MGHVLPVLGFFSLFRARSYLSIKAAEDRFADNTARVAMMVLGIVCVYCTDMEYQIAHQHSIQCRN